MPAVSAPAKLNLHLHVTGRRADGYHRLDSLVAFADIGDALNFEAADRFSLSIEGRFARGLDAGDPANSVTRAAKALADYLGREADVRIALEKNLPHGAGIGGGSADAAACLKGLCDFWSADIQESDLRSLALQIGSDVPVCIKGQSVIMRGVGEILLPAPALPELHGVLIWPDCHAPTELIYKNLKRGSFSDDFKFRDSYADAHALISDLSRTSNDLEPSALSLFPVIGDAFSLLKKNACIFTRMSGSGSSVFGIFAAREKAERAARAIEKDRPDWWVRPFSIQKN